MFGNPYNPNDPRYYQYEQVEAAKRQEELSAKQIAAAEANNALLEQQNDLIQEGNHQQWWTSLSDREKVAHIRNKWGSMYARHTPNVLAKMSEENRRRHLEMRSVFENDPLNYESLSAAALKRWAAEDNPVGLDEGKYFVSSFGRMVFLFFITLLIFIGIAFIALLLSPSTSK